MLDFHLAQLSHDHTDAPGGILAALRGVSSLHSAFNMAKYGNDDLTESAATLLAGHRVTLFQEHHWFVVLAQPRPMNMPSGRFGLRLVHASDRINADNVIAALSIALPLLDNLETASVMIHVRADHRRQGLGRVLAALAEEVGRRRGRRIMQCYIETDADDGPDALMPRDGGQSIAQDAGTRFAQAMGYRLAQVERHSVQPLPMPDVPAWRTPDGYRLVRWRGATPPGAPGPDRRTAAGDEHRYTDGRVGLRRGTVGPGPRQGARRGGGCLVRDAHDDGTA